jgi:hypothetical protein
VGELMGYDVDNRGTLEVKLGEQINEPYQMKDGKVKQGRQHVNKSTPQQQPRKSQIKVRNFHC